MVVRVTWRVWKHIKDTQVRAAFHCLPFPKSAPNQSFQSSLTLLPDTTDHSHLFIPQMYYKHLFFQVFTILFMLPRLYFLICSTW